MAIIEKKVKRWVQKSYTMEQAMVETDTASKTDNPPFKSLLVSGDDSFTNKGTLMLNDIDVSGFGNSGAVHFKVGDGWRMTIQIETENTNYFGDLVNDNSTRITVDDSKASSFVEIDMVADDWVSLDVDDISGNGIAAFKIVLNGVQWVSQSDVYEADDETYIRILKIERFEDVVVVEDDLDDDEFGPPQFPVDNTDSDGDGIIDSEDEAPFDSIIPNQNQNQDQNQNQNQNQNEEISVEDYGVLGLVFSALLVGGIIWYSIGGSNE